MKNEEIKEILDYLKPKYDIVDELGNDYKKVKFKDCKLLLDYITNLQQDLDKAIDTIEKNRQFYKCRMDEYVDLKKENERLKEKINNLEMFKYNIPNDKTKTVPTMIKSYKNEYEDYKSRCEQMEKELESWKKKYGKI